MVRRVPDETCGGGGFAHAVTILDTKAPKGPSPSPKSEPR